MSRLYSTRFIGVGAADTATYTVPPGFVAVLRDMRIFFNGAETADIYNVVGELVGGAGVVYSTGQATPGNAQLWTWDGRQVLNAGDELVFGASHDNWNFVASGYLLTTP